jgi:hypothetical protein
VAIRLRLDTMAGEAVLRQEEMVPEDGPLLALVTRGEELAGLLEGAMAFSFSHEVPEQPGEHEVVERFLRDCAEFSDVPGLPEGLREEMEQHFGQLLNTLWSLDWLVFGGAREATLEPGEHPLRGRAVTLCLARYDSPSVRMAAKLSRSMARFKAAMARIQGRAGGDESSGLPN